METPYRRLLLTTALFVATVALPATANAQRIAASCGAGMIGGADAAPAADFATPVYTVSIQRVMRTYFVLDGELIHWAQTTRHERGPHNISGPAGIEGHVSRTTEVSAHKIWNVGLNVLVRSTGAVRVFGGGASLSTDDSEYTQQSFDCSP